MDFALNVESAFATMILRRLNTWYSVGDGNWSDPNTWVSNALDKKVRTSPQAGDNVYINHAVTCDVTLAVNNLFVAGTLTADNNTRTLTVNGSLQASGLIDFTGSNIVLILTGVVNSMVNFTSGASSTVEYLSLYTQAVIPVSYCNLLLFSASSVTTATKYLQANLSVTGNLSLARVSLDTKGFNISVTGTTDATNGTSTILSTTSILFVGSVNAASGQTLNVTGAATIEMRGGSSTVNGAFSAPTSTINFTTNNQSLTGNFLFIASVYNIVGAITITNSISNGGSTAFTVPTTINGTVAGSTFTNNGYATFNTLSAQMTTGVFNMTNSGSTIAYAVTGSGTIPYNTFYNLVLSGTGTKSAGGNLTTNGSLSTSTTLELSTFNLSVGTTTSISGASGLISKTGAGSLLFVGAATASGGANGFSLAGNPAIEFRGGGMINATSGSGMGTGAISFTTNNQTFGVFAGFLGFSGTVTIASGITLTVSSSSLNLLISGVLNGSSSTSIFDNRSSVTYSNATAPMATGKLYCNQAANTFIYGLAGNQDITVPTDPTNPGYSSLTLNGSGAKKLLGNVSVKVTYTLTPPATLNSNGFSLTNP